LPLALWPWAHGLPPRRPAGRWNQRVTSECRAFQRGLVSI